MIISKASLNLAILCAGDKHIPLMNVVCIEPDGSVVATNGKVIAAVSPVSPEMCAAVPLSGKGLEDTFGQQLVLSAGTVREIVKAIPRDTQFKGILEHCSVRLTPSTSVVTVEVTDGKRRNTMTVRTVAPKWIEYKAVFKNAWDRGAEEPADGWRVVLNRKRTALMVEMIERVCPYDGDFAPVYWEFARNGNVIVRALNELTGQRMIGVLSAVTGAGAAWMEMSDWERKMVRKGAVKL